jgi:hypothetical protein
MHNKKPIRYLDIFYALTGRFPQGLSLREYAVDAVFNHPFTEDMNVARKLLGLNFSDDQIPSIVTNLVSCYQVELHPDFRFLPENLQKLREFPSGIISGGELIENQTQLNFSTPPDYQFRLSEPLVYRVSTDGMDLTVEPDGAEKTVYPAVNRVAGGYNTWELSRMNTGLPTRFDLITRADFFDIKIRYAVPHLGLEASYQELRERFPSSLIRSSYIANRMDHAPNAYVGVAYYALAFLQSRIYDSVENHG